MSVRKSLFRRYEQDDTAEHSHVDLPHTPTGFNFYNTQDRVGVQRGPLIYLGR